MGYLQAMNWGQYRLNCAATWRAEQARYPHTQLIFDRRYVRVTHWYDVPYSDWL